MNLTNFTIKILEIEILRDLERLQGFYYVSCSTKSSKSLISDRSNPEKEVVQITARRHHSWPEFNNFLSLRY